MELVIAVLIFCVGGAAVLFARQSTREPPARLLREAGQVYEAAVRSEGDLRGELLNKNVNQQDGEGDSALHMAYYAGQEGAITRLKALGADEHLRNREGLTPAEMREVAETEALLERTTACMTLSIWVDEARGRVLYEKLKLRSSRVYNPALVRLFLRERHRRRLIGLAVKVGMPGSQERLALILGTQFSGSEGKGIANIYLNSGSGELADAATRWAQANGYQITSRVSDAVARWGAF